MQPEDQYLEILLMIVIPLPTRWAFLKFQLLQVPREALNILNKATGNTHDGSPETKVRVRTKTLNIFRKSFGKLIAFSIKVS